MKSRPGFALPLVLATAAVALLIVLASTATTWRAYRGARLALAAASVDLAAERALVSAIELGTRDSLSNRPLFDTLRAQLVDAEGITLAMSSYRSSPSVAWIVASASESGSASVDAVRAIRTRALSLRPPAVPILAALTTSSAVDSSGAQLTGSLTIDASGCEGDRGRAMAQLRQLPIDTLRNQLARVWPTLVARASEWRGDAPNDPRWRAAVISTSDSVLVGPHRWQGLLLHDGSLRVIGDLTVNGVLIVRGHLDASAARLTVLGALIVADSLSLPVRLGSARIQWERCAVAMALGVVSQPVSAPFDVWRTVTP